MKRRALLVLAPLFAANMVSPGGSTAKFKVVTSFSILADLVAQIGGEDVEVRTLVGPNSDAHAFDPAPADAKALTEAELFVINGLGFEPWHKKLIEASGFSKPVIIASEGVAGRPMKGSQERDIFDPHAWQDLRNSVIYVKNIEAALKQADPASAKNYASRAQTYVAKLRALDADIRARFAKIPEAKRKVITSHDAFSYFGEAYGVRFQAPEGLSTEAEPAAGEVAALIRQIRAEGIKAFFVENISDPRMIEMIANETGAVPGEALYSDALSPPDGPATTYIAMFESNVQSLIQGMQAK
jgi:zinc/manganese transport system substrate-binding protein